jgi:hypothetical protein
MADQRVSEGRARAVLEAFGGAGRIIRRQGVSQFGAPADIDIHASIRPFSDPNLPFNERHYCAEDWHVILVAQIAGGDQSFTRQKAGEELDPVAVTFELDGAFLSGTERTSIRRFNDPEHFVDGWEEAYFFAVGRVMAPDELTVGSHTLSYAAVSPTEQQQDQITFFIDPPGEGACL